LVFFEAAGTLLLFGVLTRICLVYHHRKLGEDVPSQRVLVRTHMQIHHLLVVHVSLLVVKSMMGLKYWSFLVMLVMVDNVGWATNERVETKRLSLLSGYSTLFKLLNVWKEGSVSSWLWWKSLGRLLKWVTLSMLLDVEVMLRQVLLNLLNPNQCPATGVTLELHGLFLNLLVLVDLKV
jgi:hypothetical protein